MGPREGPVMHFNTQEFPTAEAYREHLATFDRWNQRIFLSTVALMGWPGNYLDIGCGTGIMVETARALEIPAHGLDLLIQPDDSKPWLHKQDLTIPFDLQVKFQMITCIEVVEHIHKKKIDIFMDNIIRHKLENGMVVFTAASPGQGGEHHKTLRPGYQWRDYFWNRYEMNYREDLTTRLRMAWNLIPMPMQWLTANVQVFT
jgi:hypothetical protein